MRTALFILVTLVVQFSAIGQNYYGCNVLPGNFWCDQQVWLRTLDPVQDTELIILDTVGHNGLWQRGPVSKSPFVDFGAINGIVTDSIAPYPSSVRAHFIVKIPNNDTLVPGGPQFILFEHRYDTDNADKCFIEYSCDEGFNWSKVKYWNSNEILQGGGPMAVNTWNYPDLLIYPNDTMTPFGYSGASFGWITSGIQWVWSTSLFRPDDERSETFCQFGYNDTLLVRFVFESDSLESNRSGWMIRGIAIGSSDQIMGSVSDPTTNSQLRSFPNPTTGMVDLQLNVIPETVQVLDMAGKVVESHQNVKRVNMSEFPPGTYFIRAYSNRSVSHGRVVKL